MSSRFATARRGFTLIELIVVLLILVGLAGVLIPAVTSMVGRTHTSTAAANIAEVANAIQRFEVQYMSYPDGFDSLSENLGATGNQLGTLEVTLAEVTLTVDTVETLEHAGITTVGVHGDDAGTFDPVTLTGPLATGNILLGLTPAQQAELGLETTASAVAGKYICLGVGPTSAMNGKTMVDAPVHFPESGEDNPATTYQRFIAVFQVGATDLGADPADPTDNALVPIERAKLVAVISPHGDGLGGHIGEYFEIATQD